MRKSQSAFTLVEMMIVVVIIALLAAISIPNMLRSRQQAQEATAQGNLKLIANALENYAAINSVYPNNTTVLMGTTPPYLSSDYFTGVHGGYTFAHNLTDYTYMISAFPTGTTPGVASFTVTTGAIITKY